MRKMHLAPIVYLLPKRPFIPLGTHVADPVAKSRTQHGKSIISSLKVQ